MVSLLLRSHRVSRSHRGAAPPAAAPPGVPLGIRGLLAIRAVMILVAWMIARHE